MAQSKLYPVVMAGGSGSRLWPLSRVLYPKQFLCLKGDLTMLQTTICRLNGVECESPVVICNEQHRFIVAEQLRQLNKLTENIILEPAGRNTAPAIALAALAAKRHSPESDPLMLVLAADHVIADEDAFRAAVRNAMPYAEAGKLVTFGIVPDLPEPVMAIFVAVKCLRVSRIWWPLKWRSLSKNRIWKPLRPMWQAANITGTAVCSCSAPDAISKN